MASAMTSAMTSAATSAMISAYDKYCDNWKQWQRLIIIETDIPDSFEHNAYR